MSNPQWPLSLPQGVHVSGFEERLQEQAIRSGMDSGPAKLRRRFTAAIRNFKFAIWLDTGQKATLDAFFDATLGGGVLAFDWTDPVSGEAVAYRFVDPPVYSAVGPHTFSAQLVLEKLP